MSLKSIVMNSKLHLELNLRQIIVSVSVIMILECFLHSTLLAQPTKVYPLEQNDPKRDMHQLPGELILISDIDCSAIINEVTTREVKANRRISMSMQHGEYSICLKQSNGITECRTVCIQSGKTSRIVFQLKSVVRSILLLSPDADCEISIDGQKSQRVRALEVIRSELSRGEHFVRTICLVAPNCRDTNSFIMVARREELEVYRLMIRSSADAKWIRCQRFNRDSVDQAHKKQLHLNHRLRSAVTEQRYSRCQDLLKQGADPNFLDEDGYSLLLLAISEEHSEIVNLLLDGGADANKTCYSIHPIYLAAEMGSVSILNALSKKNANFEDQLQQRVKNPLSIAVKEGHSDVVRLLVLLAAERDFTIDITEAMFLRALEESDSQILRLLILAGFNTSQKLSNGKYPILFCIENGYGRHLESLIQDAGNVEITDKHGNTPLHLAARENDIEAAKVLVKHGASLDSVNNYNRTALDIAKSYGNTSIVKLLSIIDR